ncbi:MAG: cytochrome ubiquinol oxidase subunit I [Proteobacteria bacterium]|nr:cytochrome ubiquinol oxidase subunit I [Pseudomonadota bacterium]
MTFDPLILARIQFAFTMSFHIIFPAFTIGLAGYLACVEALYLKTKDKTYKEIYKFWVKIFAIIFGMGVVSGLVISYEIGTNWSGFSLRLGNVLGPLFGMEVLTAFFLEASFLGIMLFGWNRVSPKIHFASTIIVAIGTLISAFWIIAANSWMQTPQSFMIYNITFYSTDWLKTIFNPSFPYRFTHMVVAAYLTCAFVVCGISAWFLWKKKSAHHAKVMFKMALSFIVIFAPLQILIGDMHGLNTLKYQPMKVAAMEGIWEDEVGAPLTLFGFPDQESEATKYAIKIPKLASLILKHDANAKIYGLKSVAKNERPPVAPVFFSFRVMVAIAMMMLTTGVLAVFLNFRKKLFNSKWFQFWCMAMTPSGFIALLAGWFVTEIGRQPYVVYGFVTTKDIASPVVSEQVTFSLLSFAFIYFIIFGAATFYILRLIRKGF